MDFGFYKRASRGIKHRAAATPFFYTRKPPAQVAPAVPAQQAMAGSKAKQPAAATVVTTMPALPSSPVAATEAVASNGGVVAAGGVVGGGDAADVDRRAAMYISRVQERLRRERTVDDWRMYY